MPAAARRPRRDNPWRRPAGPMVWAHRGDSAHVTENTVAAFESARDAGADGVELDVRVCASGELVVFHDEDLRRLAGRDERVDQLDFATLRAIELTGGHRIATLDEVFAVVGPGLAVNVEIKAPRPGHGGPAVTGAVEAIVRAGAADRVLVSSFDPVALLQVKRRLRGLATAFLFHKGEPAPLRGGRLASLLFPRALHPEHVLVDAARVEIWHRSGWAVNVWTVDDPARLRELARLGVGGVFANDPRAARAALGGARGAGRSRQAEP